MHFKVETHVQVLHGERYILSSLAVGALGVRVFFTGMEVCEYACERSLQAMQRPALRIAPMVGMQSHFTTRLRLKMSISNNQ